MWHANARTGAEVKIRNQGMGFLTANIALFSVSFSSSISFLLFKMNWASSKVGAMRRRGELKSGPGPMRRRKRVVQAMAKIAPPQKVAAHPK